MGSGFRGGAGGKKNQSRQLVMEPTRGYESRFRIFRSRGCGCSFTSDALAASPGYPDP